MSHGDQLSKLPEDFAVVARTPTAPYAAIAHKTKPIYGIQFHPEVTHSPRGKEIFEAFVGICGCRTDWTMVSNVWRAGLRELQIGGRDSRLPSRQSSKNHVLSRRQYFLAEIVRARSWGSGCICRLCAGGFLFFPYDL